MQIRMLCMAVLLVAAASFVAASLGQSGPEPRMIVFEHDGVDTTGYALYVTGKGGKEQRFDLGYVAPDPTGTIRLPLPNLAPGTYQLAVAAYKGTNESARIPAAPPQITIGRNSPQPAEPVATPVPIPDAPAAVPPGPRKEPTEGSGIFRWLWRLLAGSDKSSARTGRAADARL